MYEMAKKAREDMKSKAQGLTGAVKGGVDASGWTEPTINAEAQTGLRPISRRQYKDGGAVSGSAAVATGGRAARKSGGSNFAKEYVNRDVKKANAEEFGAPHIGGLKCGGRAHRQFGGVNLTDPRAAAAARMQQAGQLANVPTSVMNFGGLKKGLLSPTRAFKSGGAVHSDEAEDKALIRKMVKADCRDGRKRGGGNWIKKAIKHPGALHKELGVPEGHKIPEKKLEKAEHSSNPTERKRAHLAETLKRMHHAKGGSVKEAQEGEGFRPTGGREARKHGGKAKGKTNINIVIAGHPGGGSFSPGMPPQPPHPLAPAVNPPSMPAAGPALPMPPGPPMPPQAPMMGRKRGGRAYPIDDGAGSGEGRLEKIKAYGAKPPK